MKYTILTATLALMSSWQMYAQVTLKKYDEPGKSGYQSIIFEYEEDAPASASRQGAPAQKVKVRKEFDIQGNNPFSLAKREGMVNRLLKDVRPEMLEKGTHSTWMLDQKVAEVFFSHYESLSGDAAIVQYSEEIFVEGQGDIASLNSVLIVLDKRGNEIFNLSDLNGFSSVVVSGGNELVAFNYGGFCIESDDCAYEGYGIKVFDIQRKKLIDHATLGIYKSLGIPISSKGLIFTEFKISQNDFLFTAYDGRKRLKYSIHLDGYQHTHKKARVDDGLVVENRGGLIDTLKFNSDFDILGF